MTEIDDEMRKSQLFLSMPGSPQSTQVGYSTIMIGENYANRQREGPCGLALSCLKVNKQSVASQNNLDSSNQKYDSQDNINMKVEDVDEVSTHKRRPTTSNTNLLTPLANLHQRQNSSSLFNPGNQTTRKSLMNRRKSSTSQISTAMQQLMNDKRAAEQELQEKSQMKLVSLLGSSIKKKITQHEMYDQQFEKMTQQEQYYGSNQNISSQHSQSTSMPIESLRVFQLFKVPMMKLKQITTLESKIDFLIEHASNNIKEQLRSISQIENERQQNIKIFKKQMKDQFNDEHFQGLYSWLKVNSPGHEGLIKKLRTKLIESLQSQDLDKRPRSARFDPKLREPHHFGKVISDNPGNLLVSGSVLSEAIGKTFKPFLRTSLQKIESVPNIRKSSHKMKGQENPLNEKKEVKTFKNLNNMMKDLEQEAIEKKKLIIRPKTTKGVRSNDEDQNIQDGENQPTIEKIIKNDAVAKFFDSLPAQSWDDVREKEKRQQMDQLLKQFSIEQKSAYDKNKTNWNDKLENIFKLHKKDIRLGLTQYSSTGPWNKVVLGQMDQLRKDIPKVTSQKDLQKAYNNLNYEKVKEIVNTIPTLNECLDKRIFQKSVNNLPKDEMNKIETQIAEDILWTYSRKKYNYQSARNKFFKSRVRSSLDKIKEADEKFQTKAASINRKKEYHKLSKRYRTILNGLDRGAITLKQNKNDPVFKLYQQGLHNFKEPQPLQMNPLKDANDFLNTRMALDQFSGTGKAQLQPKYDRAVPHKFFIEKYAGGPSSNETKRKQVSIHDIMKAAIRIQSWARIVMAKKIARDKKNEFERRKFIYEENLKLQQQKLEKEMFYRQATVFMEQEDAKLNTRNFNQNLNTQSSYLHTSHSPSRDLDMSRSRQYKANNSSQKKEFRFQIESDIFVSKSKGHNQAPLFQQSNGSINANPKQQVNIIQGQPKFMQTFSTSMSKDQLYKADINLDMKEKTYKTPGQLKKNMQMVVQNMFQACKKGNWNYIEKNKDRLNLKVIQSSKDEKGNTPLYVAVANKQLETARYLLEKGTAVNSRNENGNTPLHRAFMNQDYEMIGLLQSNGANFDIVNELNQTPLYFGSRLLIEKLGIKNKAVNYVSMNELQKDKAQALIKKATKLINDNPKDFIEESEEKEAVINGIAKRMVTQEMLDEFSPLYNANSRRQ